MVAAAVEGQEVGLPSSQPGGHPYLVRVHREVDQGALLEREQQVAPVALVLVLAYRVGGALPGQRVLEFGGDDGDAVDGEGHVDDAAAVLALRRLHDRGEGDLARNGQPVGGVILGGLRVHARVGPEIRHAERLAVTLETVAQDVQRALDLEFLGQVVQNGGGGLRPQQRLERLPFGRLALFQEAANVVGKEGEGLVEGVRIALFVTAGTGQSGFDRRFEVAFGVAGHGVNLPAGKGCRGRRSAPPRVGR